jgi:hypothetical protein
MYAALLARIYEEKLVRKGKDRVVMLSTAELLSLPDESIQERLRV